MVCAVNFLPCLVHDPVFCVLLHWGLLAVHTCFLAVAAVLAAVPLLLSSCCCALHAYLQQSMGASHLFGAADHVYTFAIDSQIWSKHTVHNSNGLVLCRHTATALPNQQSIALLGGGMNCFGFGTTFSVPVMLDLTRIMHKPGCAASVLSPAPAKSSASAPSAVKPLPENSLHQREAATERMTDPGAATASSVTAGASGEGSSVCTHQNGFSTVSISGEAHGMCSAVPLGQGQQPAGQKADLAVPQGQGQQPQGPGQQRQGRGQQPQGQGQQSAGPKLGFAVNKLQAKAAKDALKGLGWLDQSFKAGLHEQRICLPLTDKGGVALIKMQGKCVESQTTPNGHIDGSDCQATGTNAQHTCHLLTDNGDIEHSKLQSKSEASQQAANGDTDSSDCQAAGTHLQQTCVPLTDNGGLELSKPQSKPQGSQKATNGHTNSSDCQSTAIRKRGRSLVANGDANAHEACLRGLVQNDCAALQSMQPQLSSRHEGGPATRLKAAITQLLQNQVTSLSLL